ncbi:PREDICTED: myosin heavy chain IB, partial [Capra hircus]|uniref:myosin heavy chain IB n=1 Tax=Capra hircus TaxID=9925 RepID=UPI0006B1217A
MLAGGPPPPCTPTVSWDGMPVSQRRAHRGTLRHWILLPATSESRPRLWATPGMCPRHLLLSLEDGRNGRVQGDQPCCIPSGAPLRPVRREGHGRGARAAGPGAALGGRAGRARGPHAGRRGALRRGGARARRRSDAVVAVHIAADVPEDHVEDEQDGEDEQRHQDGLGHGRDERLHGPGGARGRGARGARRSRPPSAPGAPRRPRAASAVLRAGAPGAAGGGAAGGSEAGPPPLGRGCSRGGCARGDPHRRSAHPGLGPALTAPGGRGAGRAAGGRGPRPRARTRTAARRRRAPASPRKVGRRRRR